MVQDGPITETFMRWRRGEPGALDALMPRVYDELRVLAGSYMRGERAGHTLQPTALVHEAFMKLLRLPEGAVQDRLHFFALRVREAYGDSVYDRLVAVKTTYDPDNVFRHNQNIRPRLGDRVRGSDRAGGV